MAERGRRSPAPALAARPVAPAPPSGERTASARTESRAGSAAIRWEVVVGAGPGAPWPVVAGALVPASPAVAAAEEVVRQLWFLGEWGRGWWRRNELRHTWPGKSHHRYRRAVERSQVILTPILSQRRPRSVHSTGNAPSFHGDTYVPTAISTLRAAGIALARLRLNRDLQPHKWRGHVPRGLAVQCGLHGVSAGQRRIPTLKYRVLQYIKVKEPAD